MLQIGALPVIQLVRVPAGGMHDGSAVTVRWTPFDRPLD